MLLDLHVHTRHSGDNDCDPEELFRRAREIGLDAICVTEHHSVEASEPLEEAAQRHGLLLLRGCEASTDRGHLLLYGVRTDCWNTWRGSGCLEAAEVIRAARAEGAAVVAAHPFRRGLNRVVLGDGLRDLDVDGVEVLNGGASDEENARALAVAVERGLAQTGGSDAHAPAHVGRCLSEVEGGLRSVGDLARAILDRRVRAVRGRR